MVGAIGNNGLPLSYDRTSAYRRASEVKTPASMTEPWSPTRIAEAEPASAGAPVAGTDATAAVPATNLGDVLGDALTQARALEQGANQSAEALARGEGGIHEVMIAQEKASIAVRYAVTMKNRALEAYREIMNTQI
ncbi:flagellar hook-basal body complex protein FliE [Myxococcota bacterium]|nr:flagellar hook-basal body complex protein FliE [Myxococcota bacterium]